MLTGASASPVTACHARPNNQPADKQHVGICAGSGALKGCKAEVILVDYFLERRGTDEQSVAKLPFQYVRARAVEAHVHECD